MCMFCAAVPAVIAAGTALDGEQHKRQREVDQRGEKSTKPHHPIRALTMLTVLALFIGLALYHIFQPSG